MSRLASRIVLTILLFPALIVTSSISGGLASLLSPFIDDVELVIGVSLANATAFAVAFWLNWRGVVAWTPRRTSRTWIWSGACASLAVASLAALVLLIDRWNVIPWLIIAVAAAGLLWTIGVVRLWQESSKERSLRIAATGVNTALCPVCRYDLSGLTNLRCPECGNEFTLGRIQDEQRRRLSPPGLD
ncbi:MAG: hypothetical protein KF768_04475 [Phycisphaeraceae bacterium]|nr:hypothetical protein [Phycisphaeraceae bacterium]